MALMNTDAKFLKLTLANKILQHMKGILQLTKRKEDRFKIQKSFNVIHHINKFKNENHTII